MSASGVWNSAVARPGSGSAVGRETGRKKRRGWGGGCGSPLISVDRMGPIGLSFPSDCKHPLVCMGRLIYPVYVICYISFGVREDRCLDCRWTSLSPTLHHHHYHHLSLSLSLSIYLSLYLNACECVTVCAETERWTTIVLYVLMLIL